MSQIQRVQNSMFLNGFKHRKLNELKVQIDLKFVCLNNGNGSDLETKTPTMSTKMVLSILIYMYIKMCCGMAWPSKAVELSSNFNLVSDSTKD